MTIRAPGPGPGPAVPALPPGWPARAAVLAALGYDLGAAKQAATEIHAAAYLAASGPAEQRTQEAKQAAAKAQLAVDEARSVLEAYRLLVNTELRLITSSPPEWSISD